MKKSVVLLCIVVVLGGFCFDQSKVPHQKQINQLNLTECQRLMIVALLMMKQYGWQSFIKRLFSCLFKQWKE